MKMTTKTKWRKFFGWAAVCCFVVAGILAISMASVAAENNNPADTTQPIETTQPSEESTQLPEESTQPPEESTQPPEESTQPPEESTQPPETTTPTKTIVDIAEFGNGKHLVIYSDNTSDVVDHSESGCVCNGQ